MRSRGANEEKVEMPQVAIQGSSGFFAGLRLRSTDELGDRREVVPWKDPIVEGQPGDYLVRRERPSEIRYALKVNVWHNEKVVVVRVRRHEGEVVGADRATGD